METRQPHESQSQQVPVEGSPSNTELLKGIVHDGRELLSKEIALARLEMKDELRKAGTAASWAGLAGGVAAVGGVLLGLGAVYLLALTGLALWASFVIVGGAGLVSAAALGAVALRKSKQVEAIPRQSLTAAGRDVIDINQWARRSVRREVDRARGQRPVRATEAE